MAAVAEYESEEEGGGRGAEGGDGGGERDAIIATHSPRSVGARGGGEGEGGALCLRAGRHARIDGGGGGQAETGLAGVLRCAD